MLYAAAGQVLAGIDITALTGSWPTATRSAAVFILIAMAVIAGLALLFHFMRSLNAVAAGKRASREAFSALSKKFTLNTAEITLLKKAILNSGLTESELIFRNIEYFEIGVGRELEKCSENPVLLRNVSDTIASTRRKLGFLKIPAGARYFSSRELSTGQPLTLRVPEDAAEEKYRATLVEITELSMSAEFADNAIAPLSLRQDGLLQVSLFKQGEAEYSFLPRVLRVAPDRRRITFEHAIEMNRRQVRSHVRIEVNNQATFRILKSPAAPERAKGAIRHSGTITDISGGGLSLQTEAPLNGGDIILLGFPLRSNAFHGVRGIVLRAVPREVQGAPMFENHVEYDNVETSVKEKIIRLIFEMQREELQWQK
ncbi:MAG: PilZ domain-containing protein [Fibrobacterota bacterium]